MYEKKSYTRPLLFIIFVLIYILVIELSKLNPLILNTQFQQKFPVYIAALVTSDDWVRSTVLYDTWGKEIVQRYGGIFRFSAATTNERFENITIVNQSLADQDYKKLLYLFKDSVKDFLENTNLHWIYRTTEDCFVNVDLYGKYIKKFFSHNSPFRYVIKGQLCVLSSKFFYAHGGSGWIMSRAAARRFYELFDEIEPYYASVSYGDDVVLYNFTSRMGINAEDIKDDHFLGSSFTNSDFDALRTVNFTGLRKCYGNEKIKLKNIVFWHSGREDNFQMLHGKEISKRLPDNLYYQYHRMCLNF